MDMDTVAGMPGLTLLDGIHLVCMNQSPPNPNNLSRQRLVGECRSLLGWALPCTVAPNHDPVRRWHVLGLGPDSWSATGGSVAGPVRSVSGLIACLQDR